MRKLYILPVLFMFLFSNCEKVIDVDVPSIPPKLVIDAAFEVNFDENPVTASTIVRLSLSADYFDTSIPTVTNATVFVTNLSNNAVINFSDNNLDGEYEPTSTFVPEENVEYELTVIYENETYVGKATRVKSVVLDNITQGDETLFSGDETEIEVEFTDDGTREDYYLFDFSNNIYFALEDRFFNGAVYNFSYFYEEDDIELPATVDIKMSGITEEYFTYFRILIEQGGQDGGSPFEPIPSLLLGNMVNTTDRDNFPLGYFHISETDTFTVQLVDNN